MARISEEEFSDDERPDRMTSADHMLARNDSPTLSRVWQEDKKNSPTLTTYTSEKSMGGKLCFIIPETNPFRKMWNVVLVWLLIYTGTIFPYRLCFVNSNIDGTESDSGFWKLVELAVDIAFYIDLFVWFIFTYREVETGKENFNFSCIVVNYLRTFFILNLIACIPSEFVTFVLSPFLDSGGSSTDVNKIARLTRLQRASRMVAKAAEFARLFRMVNVFRCSSFAFWRWIQKWRYMRIVNFVCGLFWVVHIVACGWYLVASFHADKNVTWVARRDLLQSSPFDQWVHANYFILTVFTTVGFGDISAHTTGEIFYVSFAMIIGTIVQSTIMGEVINIVSSADQRTLDMRAQKLLLKSFTDHVRLHDNLSLQLMMYIESNRSHRHQLKRDEVRTLLTSNVLPRDLLESLANGMFRGDLVKNKFITTCVGYQRKIPPRFPLLLALMLNERHYVSEELVYLSDDYPWTLFLVLRGTFAYVAFPSSDGGKTFPPDALEEKIRGISGTTGSKSDISKRRRSTPSGKSKDNLRHSMTSDSSNNPLERYDTKVISTELFAFQLFGPATYFGDLELMISGVKTRLCSARCECDKGQVLELQREDLLKLMADFRSFGQAWRRTARRRDEQRKFSLWRLRDRTRKTKHGSKLQNFAASCIQRHWRMRYGGDIDRQRFFIHALTESRKEVETRPSIMSEEGNRVAELGDEVAGVKATLVTMQENLNEKVGSIEDNLAMLTDQMSDIRSLLLQHLGADLPKEKVVATREYTISSV